MDREKEIMVEDLNKNARCFIFGVSEEWPTEDFVDELYGLGYRKIVWHKVEDGDLPTESKEIRWIDNTNNYYNGFYDSDDRQFHADVGCYFNEDEVVAWTELQEYKEQEI